MSRRQSLQVVPEKRKTSLFLSLRNLKSSKDLSEILSKSKPLTPKTLNQSLASRRYSIYHLKDDTNSKEHILEDNATLSSQKSPKVQSKVITSPSSDKTLVPDEVACDAPESIYLDVILKPLASEDLDNDNGSTKTFQESTSSFANFSRIEEVSRPSKLHRSINMSNMKEMLASMNDQIIPLANRKSIDVESSEIKELLKMLSHNQHLSMSLVENVLFMNFYEDSADASIDRHLRTWDEIDTNEIFKQQSYNDNISYMLL